jgi:hypothetical protein
MSQPDTWLLTYRNRPWLLNGERSGGKRGIGGHYGRAQRAAEWREEFGKMCLIQRVPPLRWVDIDALQVCGDRRLPDIGNCYPAVKAAIDGVVDAGVIPNDRGEPFLRSIRFLPPKTVGYDALILRLTGPPCSIPELLQRAEIPNRKLLRQAAARR